MPVHHAEEPDTSVSTSQTFAPIRLLGRELNRFRHHGDCHICGTHLRTIWAENRDRGTVIATWPNLEKIGDSVSAIRMETAISRYNRING